MALTNPRHCAFCGKHPPAHSQQGRSCTSIDEEEVQYCHCGAASVCGPEVPSRSGWPPEELQKRLCKEALRLDLSQCEVRRNETEGTPPSRETLSVCRAAANRAHLRSAKTAHHRSHDIGHPDHSQNRVKRHGRLGAPARAVVAAVGRSPAQGDTSVRRSQAARRW